MRWANSLLKAIPPPTRSRVNATRPPILIFLEANPAIIATISKNINALAVHHIAPRLDNHGKRLLLWEHQYPRCQASCRFKDLTLRYGVSNGNAIFGSIYRASIMQGVFSRQAGWMLARLTLCYAYVLVVHRHSI